MAPSSPPRGAPSAGSEGNTRRGLRESTPGARGPEAPAARGCHTWRAPASHPGPFSPGCTPCPPSPPPCAPKFQSSPPPIPSISVAFPPPPPPPASTVVTPAREESRMFAPWLNVTGEREEVDPEKASPSIPPAQHQRGRPQTDLLPRAASPSAPTSLSRLLSAAASSPRCLFYPRRHEVTAAAKLAARQGTRNLVGPCAPPLNLRGQSPYAVFPM